MSKLGEWRQLHSEMVAITERFGRLLSEAESKAAARNSQPQAADDGRDEQDHTAKSMADLVTPKQLGMIRALAREAGVDWELECSERMGCTTEELSKRSASTFIDHLKTFQANGADFRRAG